MRKRVVASLMLALSMMVAVPALADGPPVQFTVDVEIPAVNPCTGLDHVLASTVTVTAHEFDETHHHHERALITGDIVTDDGYSGRGQLATTLLETHTDEIWTDVTHFFLTNAGGQRIITHMVFHINQVDSSPIAVLELESSKCVGRPG